MRTKYKAWAKPFLDEHKEVQIELEELANRKDVYLEIGSGKGEFLIKMATKYPDKLFIGVEKNVTCAGITAKKMVEVNLPNCKLIYGDAWLLPLNLCANRH